MKIKENIRNKYKKGRKERRKNPKIIIYIHIYITTNNNKEKVINLKSEGEEKK